MSRLAGGKALPAELLEQILAKTDGVPLFVEELTKAILESGELKDAGDHYDYAGTAHTITIPATCRDSLMARLDRFAPVKEIAQIGAAIGREFSYELIAAVAPRHQDRARQRARPADRIGAGVPARHPARSALHLQARPGAGRGLRFAAQEPAPGVARARSRACSKNTSPTTKDTEPELLAHHLTAAGETEAAIGYWRKAGELALKRLALNEAISHLNKGMELIGTLAQSAQRDASELDLRIPLGAAWMALKGWAAPEVWTSFHPALGLAKSLSRHEALVPIYYGLWVNVQNQGRVAEGLDWVNEMLASAEATGDPDLLIMGHRAACSTHYYRGDLIQSREHGDRVLALYDEEQHRHLADFTNVDPKTAVGVYASLVDLDARLSGSRRAGERCQRCARSPARSPFRPRLGAHRGRTALGFPLRTRAVFWRASRRLSGWAGRTICPLSPKCWRRSSRVSPGCGQGASRRASRICGVQWKGGTRTVVGFGCLTFERSWPKAWR